MTKRDKILSDIEQLEADERIPALQRELEQVREFINEHELTKAKAKAVALASDIERAEMRRSRDRDALEAKLKSAEPAALADIRQRIQLAHHAHCMADVPAVTPGFTKTIEDADRHRERGEALAAAAGRLRDAWMRPDWRGELREIIERYKAVLPELRHVVIEESENVEV